MRIANDFYLIIDLEATCSDDGVVPRHEMEIIDIGAVLQSTRTFEIDSDYQTFVRPVRHPHLTAFCNHLTGIRQHDVADAPLFPEALAALLHWLAGTDALFCSWGEYDAHQFAQDCAFHDVPYPFPSGHLNLKAEFARTFGKRKQGIDDALRAGHAVRGQASSRPGRRPQHRPAGALGLHGHGVALMGPRSTSMSSRNPSPADSGAPSLFFQ